MDIRVGMAAPLFRIVDTRGNTVDLGAYAGKTVLLSFFRNAACALCNLRVHRLIGRYPHYKRSGLEIIAVFESPEQNMIDHVGMQDAPFPLIADPHAQLYDLYGVEISEQKIARTMEMPETQVAVQDAAAIGFPLVQEEGSNFNRLPADFLIGPNGIIQLAHYANYVTDHLSFEVIEQQLGLHVAA